MLCPPSFIFTPSQPSNLCSVQLCSHETLRWREKPLVLLHRLYSPGDQQSPRHGPQPQCFICFYSNANAITKRAFERKVGWEYTAFYIRESRSRGGERKSPSPLMPGIPPEAAAAVV